MTTLTKPLGAAHAVSGPGYQERIRIGAHELLADEPVASGGTDTGPNPFSFLLAGLAACTGITLKMYAERHGWTLGDLRVDVEWFAGEERPRLRRVLRFPPEVTEAQRVRLAEIAEKTPVSKALSTGFFIETTSM